MDVFTPLITEICQEENINCEPLSHGWILRLTRDGQARHIVGRHFDTNAAAADLIACDKAASSTLLRHNGIPMIPHTLFFNPSLRSHWVGDEGEWARARAFFEANGGRVVVKPNRGWQGRDVYLCETPKALERAMHVIFQNEPDVCLCPFYELAHEYRVFYVNGTCRYQYGKERAVVTGDGLRSLRTLAEECGVQADNQFFAHDPDYIPARGERVRVAWKHNLSGGAAAFEIQDKALIARLHQLAGQAARCIHIAFATVDLALTAAGELVVVEINAGVTATKLLAQYPDRRETIKGIYAEAIRAMFTRESV